MEVLKTLYCNTYSLVEYLNTLPGCPVILQDDDKQGYKTFLRNTVVAIPSGCGALQQPINFQQLSDQIEVVLRVIKKLSKQTKNGKNVLLIGWQQAPRSTWTCGESGASDMGHFLPGNTAGQLKTPNWKRLLNRIGDEVMMHLLCNLSIFVKAPPSSFIQLTGTPVYDMIVTVTKVTKPAAPQFLMQSQPAVTGLANPSQRSDVKQLMNNRRKKRKRTSSEGDLSVPVKRLHQDSIQHCTAGATTQLEMSSKPYSQGVTRSKETTNYAQTGCDSLVSKGVTMLKERTSKTQTRCDSHVSRGETLSKETTNNVQTGCGSHVLKGVTKSKEITSKTQTCVSKGGKMSKETANITQTRCEPNFLKGETLPKETSKTQARCNSHVSKSMAKENNIKLSGASKSRIDAESKKFYAVEMCYSHGGREKLAKSHPMEALSSNAVGARRLTGLIFNINSINNENKETQLTNQTKSDGHIMRVEDAAGEFTGLKPKKVLSCEGEKQTVVGTVRNQSRKKKRKKKPRSTPRRYIKVQKLLHAMITYHKKTSIYYLLKYHCPIRHGQKPVINNTGIKCYQQDLNPTPVNRLEPAVQCVLGMQNGDCSPIVYHRRPPSQDDFNQDTRDVSESAIPTSSTSAAVPKQEDAAELIAMATLPWQVYLFIRSVLIRVVPHQLWGSMHNRTVFFKYVKRYLQLGRFEKLSLHQLVKDVQISDYDWIKLDTKCATSHRPPSDLLKQHQMVADFLGWLMENYVITLVKTMFYVTESSLSRNQLLFFRKPIWHKLERIGAKNLLDTGVLKPLVHSVAMEMMKSERSLGCSNLRFLPKTSSLRPIVNMGKSCMQSKKCMSINILLQDLYDVLTHIKNTNPALFGSAVLGTDTIYPEWRQFVQSHRKYNAHRQLYFVKLDIEKCYESIKHDKLFQIITTLLTSQPDTREFVIRRYAMVTMHQGKLQRAFVRHVSTSQEVGSDFHRVLTGLAKEGQQLKNAVIVNQVSQHTETPASLMSRLKHHVNCDVLKCSGQHYLRTSGISQGSIVSSLLCSYFYAHMEKCCLSGIDEDGLLLHLVDDFLLVTPHLDKAHRFLNVLLKGLPQYGCRTNPDKTLTSFPFEYQGTPIKSLEQEALFPWCGLLFDTSSLHVYNEYARYHGIRIRYTLTMDTSDDVYSAMKSKLKKSLQAKDVCIFVDPLINSGTVIIINSYHMLLMLAFRFHAYCSNLPTSCKAGLTTNRLMGLILHMCNHFHYLVHNKLSSHNALVPEVAFPLTQSSVTWLCLKAFWTKLSKHQTAYKSLLKTINRHRHKVNKILGCEIVAELQSCCTPDLPYDFMQML